jgi:hypothetical protein
MVVEVGKKIVERSVMFLFDKQLVAPPRSCFTGEEIRTKTNLVCIGGGRVYGFEVLMDLKHPILNPLAIK